jgi:hypothetical protein
VKNPRLPSCTPYPRHHLRAGHGRFAPPADGPKSSGGLWELQSAQDHRGRSSSAAGGQPSPRSWAIPLGGGSRQVVAARVEGRVNGPAVGVTHHNLLRPHGDCYGTAIRVAMGPSTIIDVAPSDFHQVLPEAVPVPCAGDDRDLSGAAPPS